jgi:hypothetical protein
MSEIWFCVAVVVSAGAFLVLIDSACASQWRKMTYRSGLRRIRLINRRWIAGELFAVLLSSNLVAHAQPVAGKIYSLQDFEKHPSEILAISSPDNHCPVEPHPKAINPVTITCHAEFAPLPVIPPLTDHSTPEQRLAVGDWLVRQLNQKGACSSDTKIDRQMACAVLIYVLPEEDRRTGIPLSSAVPWVYVVKIYRISHPKDPRKTFIFTVNNDDSEGSYGPDKNAVWHLLAEQRIVERCKQAKTRHVGTSTSSQGLKDDSCRGQKSDDVRYRPTLLLPLSKATLVFNKALIARVFAAPMYVVQDVESTLRSIF